MFIFCSLRYCKPMLYRHKRQLFYTANTAFCLIMGAMLGILMAHKQPLPWVLQLSCNLMVLWWQKRGYNQRAPSASNPFTPAFPKLQRRWSKTSAAAARLYFRIVAKWVFRIQRNSMSDQGGEGNEMWHARPGTLKTLLSIVKETLLWETYFSRAQL